MGCSSSSGSPLPQLHFLDHGIGHVGNQRRRDLDPVDLLQVSLDLSRRHAPRVHGDDLVVEAGPARLPLGHDLGIEAGLAVARRLQLQFAEVALESFLAFPVARVAPVVARRIVLLVAQMIGQLGLQGSFQDSFGQLFEQTVLPDDILGFLVLGEQLVDQLLVDGHGISFSSSPGRLHSSIYTLRPLTASPREHNRNRNEAKRSSVELRSLAGFFLRRLTKTRLLESWMELLTPPPIYSIINKDHDSCFELPTSFLLPKVEAGHPIRFTMDLRPPRSSPGYPACEPAALGWAACAASNTAAPPIFVREQLSLPHCRDGTSTADSSAVIPRHNARPIERPQPAKSAPLNYLAC